MQASKEMSKTNVLSVPYDLRYNQRQCISGDNSQERPCENHTTLCTALSNYAMLMLTCQFSRLKIQIEESFIATAWARDSSLVG